MLTSSKPLQQITVPVPVLDGYAFRGSRGKLHQVLRLLGVPPVGAALAVADYSTLYRALGVGAVIELDLELQVSRLILRLQGGCSSQQVPSLREQLPSLSILGNEGSGSVDCGYLLQRSFPLNQLPDWEGAAQLLLARTAEEQLQLASLTEQELSTTQTQLNTVQDDLRIAAQIQQRMLVSGERLQTISALVDCHAVMVPCLDIGGDFYDVMALDADHIAVVIGDVSGKGVTAAMMMATCMTLLRAYGESFRSPSRIMRKVNSRLIQGNEAECLFTTLFFGMINCRRNSITYCSAGHNPSLLLRGDGELEILDVVHGPALGVIEGVEYEETRLEFQPGDRLLLYTDGVSEAFAPDAQLYGFDRLIDFCRGAPKPCGSVEMITSLTDDLKAFCAGEVAHDDVTIVSVSRHLDREIAEICQVFSNAASLQGMADLMREVDGFCQQQTIDADVSGRLQLVLDELLVNVVRYGGADGAEVPRIEIDLRLRETLLIVELRDTGIPFNPFALAEPDTDLDVNERGEGGLGVFFVRALTSNFSYFYDSPWNCVRLEIELTQDSASSLTP